MKKNPENIDLQKKGLALSDEFSRLEGRRPRILVGSLCIDGIFSSNKIFNVLSDMGFDVDIAPRIEALNVLVTQSLENDADVLLVRTDRQGIEDELLEFQRQIYANQPHSQLALYHKDLSYLSHLKPKLTHWNCFDQSNSEFMISYHLLHAILHGC